MGELGFNKFLGAALGTFLFIFALNEASTYIFGGGGHHDDHHYDTQNEWAAAKFPGYHIPIAETSSGPGVDEGPVFDLGLMLASADPAAGETVLQRQCATCHTWNEGGANGTGPNLYGVIGKDIASNGSFRYSGALSGVDGDWTYEQMNDWLTNPGSFARGTSMAYVGLRSPRRDGDRVNVIAFLASTTSNAPAFPAPLVTETTAEEVADDVEGDIVVDGGPVQDALEAIDPAAAETVGDAASEAVGTDQAATGENVVDVAQDAAAEAIDTVEEAANGLLERATEAAEDATNTEEATDTEEDGEH